MKLLNMYFMSPELAAKRLEFDDEDIKKRWKDYISSIPEKGRIINSLFLDRNFKSGKSQLLAKVIRTGQLKRIVQNELADITGEEKTEKDFLNDILGFEHFRRIKRIERLEQCLNYTQTRYKYVDELLQQIHKVLKSEIHLVELLAKAAEEPLIDAQNFRISSLLTRLAREFALEEDLIKKIEGVPDFHRFLLGLVKAEHIVQRMNAKEKRIAYIVGKRMQKITSGEITEGITAKWVTAVFEGLDDAIHEAHANFLLEGYDFQDFEFVNRPEFEDLASHKIAEVRQKSISSEMLKAFVHEFREWFNFER